MSTFHALPPHPADVKLENDELYLRRRRLRLQKQRSGGFENGGNVQNLATVDKCRQASPPPLEVLTKVFSPSSNGSSSTSPNQTVKWGQRTWDIDDIRSSMSIVDQGIPVHGRGQTQKNQQCFFSKGSDVCSVGSANSAGSVSTSSGQMSFKNRPPRSPSRATCRTKSFEGVAGVVPLFPSNSCTERDNINILIKGDPLMNFRPSYQNECIKMKVNNGDILPLRLSPSTRGITDTNGKSVSPPFRSYNFNEAICSSPKAVLSPFSVGGSRAMSPNYISPTSSQSSEEDNSEYERGHFDFFDRSVKEKATKLPDDSSPIDRKISSRSLAMGYLFPTGNSPYSIESKNCFDEWSQSNTSLNETKLNNLHYTESKPFDESTDKNIFDADVDCGEEMPNTKEYEGGKTCDEKETNCQTNESSRTEKLSKEGKHKIEAPNHKSDENMKKFKINAQNKCSDTVEDFMEESKSIQFVRNSEKSTTNQGAEELLLKTSYTEDDDLALAVLNGEDSTPEADDTQYVDDEDNSNNNPSVLIGKKQDIFTRKVESKSNLSESLSSSWSSVLSDDSESCCVARDIDIESEIQSKPSDEDFESLIDIDSTMTMTFSRTWSRESDKDDNSFVPQSFSGERRMDSCYHTYEPAEGETILPFLDESFMENKFHKSNLEKPKARTMKPNGSNQKDISNLMNTNSSHEISSGFSFGQVNEDSNEMAYPAVRGNARPFSSSSSNFKMNYSLDVGNQRQSRRTLGSIGRFDSLRSDCSLPSMASDVSTVVGSVQSDASADTVDMTNRSHRSKSNMFHDDAATYRNYGNTNCLIKCNERIDQKAVLAPREDAFSVEELIRATASALAKTLDIDISNSQVDGKMEKILKQVECSVHQMMREKE
eukprot:CAMPEP_0194277768 /NCGR_PEP_ID=MMETSP0169-20130528/9995_1 /TAXON_ID=218684 /ORGANISM="Corethron pennatum, Strain L29A3" /LENGTH=880 /DNA_ID=CAMNT_0039021809 /DNA_START=166 /DNA_END=2805 /DNA_ORIENTATION=-